MIKRTQSRLSCPHRNCSACIALFLVFSCSLLVIVWRTTPTIRSPLTKLAGSGWLGCESVLKQDAYVPMNPLHPRQCYLKNYRSEDLVQCLGHLATAAKSVKDRDYFYVAFVGDSRLRQMYHSFSGMLPLYDADITGHIHTREILLHQDAVVTSNVLQVKVTFLWRPYSDEELLEPIAKWIKAGVHQTPDVLIIGNLLWTMIRSHHIQEYSYQMQNLSRLLRNLTRTTRVIWWDQDQLDEPKYHPAANVSTQGDVNNKRIRDFNEAARQVLADTGVIIWDSTHTLLGEYMRACTEFPPREDPWRHWNCRDAVHSSFLYAQLYIQRLLNYLCNPYTKLDENTCCSSDH